MPTHSSLLGWYAPPTCAMVAASTRPRHTSMARVARVAPFASRTALANRTLITGASGSTSGYSTHIVPPLPERM